jgi:aminoglycoside phosphotransferase (APT) family kinase protein
MSLERFLDEHGLGSGRAELQRIGGGHSFETYLLRREGLDAVLRRPPPPPWPPRAFDIAREARVLRALEPEPARSPRLLAFCEDHEVIGVPFAVTERMPGRVIGTDLPPALTGHGDEIAEELIDALVELQACPTEGLGPPVVDLARRVRRMREIWAANSVRDVPDMEVVADWLLTNVPDTEQTTVVHGDYRLGNVLFATSAPARLTAIMDWETASTGDPLMDVGYLVATWPEPGDEHGILLDMASVVPGGGFPSRAGLVERYAERSQRSVAALRWHVVLANWRTAVQLEGLYRRQATGIADAPFLRRLERGVPELAARARRDTNVESEVWT